MNFLIPETETIKKSEFSSCDETSVLMIILDVNLGQRLIRENPQLLEQCVDSIITLANSHLMQKSNNWVGIIACHAQSNTFIYPGPGKTLDIRQIDGQYEKFTILEKTVKQNLWKLISTENNVDTNESLLAGALAMALCYIERIDLNKPAGTTFNSRVLVVTASEDSASQYINYMNVFFAMQNQEIVLDVCTIDQHLTLLQQGCDVTGGIYLKVPQIQGLLQYLLWVFLPEPPVRQKLVLPPRITVDYRAACFCHRELIDVGYVCSVCLSIFCKFSPICTTCHTLFKIPGPLPMKHKKKKSKY